MRSKIYVGVKMGNMYERFRSQVKPEPSTHGHKYIYVIGPFRTKAGAEFMVNYGHNNPHCQTVTDAERLAKRENI